MYTPLTLLIQPDRHILLMFPNLPCRTVSSPSNYSNALGAFSRELQAGADKATSKGLGGAPSSQISAPASQNSTGMTVEEVIGQVRGRVYAQVAVTAALPSEPSLTATAGLTGSGQTSEMEVVSSGLGDCGFVVRYGRDAAAMTGIDTSLLLSESSPAADGTDNGSSSSSSSGNDGVVIESSDVTTWTASQQDYTELVYLCKYATTTQPPPPSLSSSDNSSSGSGSGVGIGGGMLSSSSSSVHVPQLALLVMNEPNPETAGKRMTH